MANWLGCTLRTQGLCRDSESQTEPCVLCRWISPISRPSLCLTWPRLTRRSRGSTGGSQTACSELTAARTWVSFPCSAFAALNRSATRPRSGYLVPQGELSASVRMGKMARIDLSTFTLDGVTVLDVAAGIASLGGSNGYGFIGGFHDGEYGCWERPQPDPRACPDR